MATYRNTTSANPAVNARIQPQNVEQGTEKGTEQKPGEEQIAVNGYQQVVEMLQAADPVFRESLLTRIGRRDPALARSLRQHL